ncbi:hypothetical protein CDD83_712 [Cordyceps sp. RAO-2017]|nr:hypothetical protein CDD83_712 [Cordyceps sp. RAO-2017]
MRFFTVLTPGLVGLALASPAPSVDGAITKNLRRAPDSSDSPPGFDDCVQVEKGKKNKNAESDCSNLRAKCIINTKVALGRGGKGGNRASKNKLIGDCVAKGVPGKKDASSGNKN